MITKIRNAFSLARVRRNERGATIIEFALIAPVLFLLLLGIVEFALIFFTSSILEGGISNAARLAKTGAISATGDDADTIDKGTIKDLVMRRGGNFLNDDNLEIRLTDVNGNPDAGIGGGGEFRTYEAIYEWEVITPIAGLMEIINPGENDWDDGIILLSSSATVYNEPFDNNAP